MSGFYLPPITSRVVLIGQSASSIAVSFSERRHFFVPTCDFSEYSVPFPQKVRVFDLSNPSDIRSKSDDN